MLGCLQCLNKQTFDGEEEGVTFEQQDIELCQAFASIAAVAIVQVRVRGTGAPPSCRLTESQ